MAWIELHQSVWTHKKTVMLAALLDIDEIYAAAHMTKLWTWALDNAQDGDLSGLPAKVIAFGAGWKGDADEFVSAAIQAGWIDQEGDRLFLHDWFDYAGRLIEKREANKERARKSRERYAQRARNVEARCDATVPNQTIPNNDGWIDNAHAQETFEQAHKRVFGFACNPLQAEQLQSYIDDGMQEAVIVRAIERAGETGKSGYNFKLIRAIVENYFKNGVRTLEQAVKLDDAYEAERKNRGDPQRSTPMSSQQAKLEYFRQKRKEAEALEATGDMGSV